MLVIGVVARDRIGRTQNVVYDDADANGYSLYADAGTNALALKGIAETLSQSMKMAYEGGISCMCADIRYVLTGAGT